MAPRRLRFARLALVSAGLLAFGLIQRQLLPAPAETSPWYALYTLERSGSLQIGAFGLLLSLAATLLAPVAQRLGWDAARVRGVLLPGVFSFAFAVVLGEVLLRVWFFEGASFGSFGGPIVERFNRDFVMNRYEGPSRGPEVQGPKSDAWRVLITGDSMSWGQGVRNEADVYTSRLLQHLRADGAPIEMAVLASPGRQIDSHLAQLRRYAPEVDPDLVIYQFYLDDMELDAGFPTPFFPWRRFFLHYFLVEHSYLWFFLDDRIPALVPTDFDYGNYMRDQYAVGQPGWQKYAGLFEDYAREAHARTDRVMVVLFPGLPPVPSLYEQVVALAKRNGVAALDLTGPITGHGPYPAAIFASPYDGHPNAETHGRISELIHDRVVELWPELLKARNLANP